MVRLLLPLNAPVASLDELDPAAAAEGLPPGAGVQPLDGAHHFGAVQQIRRRSAGVLPSLLLAFTSAPC